MTERPLKPGEAKEGGIGAGFYGEACVFFLSSVSTGSPCDLAGLQDDDQILEIDGIPASKLREADVLRLLRGPVGSKVQLKILSGFGLEQVVDLERIDISTNSIPHQYLEADGPLHFAPANSELLARTSHWRQ